MAAFEAALRASGRAAATVEAYRSDLEGVWDVIAASRRAAGAAAPSDLLAHATAAEIRGWLAARRAAGAAPRSLKRALSALRAYRRWRALSSLSDPAAAADASLGGVKGPRAPAPLPRPVTEAEARA
ncbi:MAG: site-specific integrase, partial [Pseudomonadota bacterium]